VRAVVYDAFGAAITVRDVPDPEPPPGAVVVAVRATGLCRSDWHGWRGHDDGIALPHVPGHEFAGEIAAVGAGVTGWQVGDRVTAPFVCACGSCPSCLAGNQQVCERQQQPGFTHWGSFAELVVVHYAQVNLVALPDTVSYATAAALGCRFATAYRAVLDVGRAAPGDWVAVHGCGGVGLSAVMIAVAAGARVVAVDVQPGALALARSLGAAVTINATTASADADEPSLRFAPTAAGDGPSAVSGPTARAGARGPSAVSARTARDPAVCARAASAAEVARAVVAATGGGAQVSLDALGSQAALTASIEGLRRRGRHVQVGLLAERPVVPMERVIGWELEVLGSHGMAAHAYPRMLALVADGRLRPQDLVTGELSLGDAPAALAGLDGPAPPGIRVIRP
jgi:D-arabinose 1-dehydrogenase-like Zn-dependent alcohol dehydrogenase